MVEVVDPVSRTVVVSIPAVQAEQLAITRDGARLFVADHGASKLLVVDTATDAIETTISLPTPFGVGVTHDGRYAYVANGSGSVFVVDMTTDSVTDTIAIRQYNVWVTISPDGTEAWVAEQYSYGSVAVIDIATYTVSHRINFGNVPTHVEFVPNQALAYIADQLGGVWDLDTASYSAIRSIGGFSRLGSRGATPVAILSSSDFDATEVDPLTVTLEDASVRVKGNGTPQASFKDVDGDGLLDLVLQMETEGLQLTSGDVEATLDGALFDATVIQGTDSVRIVP